MTGLGSSPRCPATVALDASVLINFLILNRVTLLAELPGHRFVVLDAVEQEVVREEQRVVLLDSFRENLVGRAGTATPDELAAFADHRRVMGLGEAACLAAAECRGWLLASDERGVFRRIARDRIGESRILTTPSLLSLAVTTGLIGVGALQDATTTLERNRFRMRRGVFGHLFQE